VVDIFCCGSEEICAGNRNREDAAVLVIGVSIVQENSFVNDGLVWSEIGKVLVEVNGESGF